MSLGIVSAVIVLVAAAAIVVVLVRAKLRGRGLPPGVAGKLRGAMDGAVGQQDPHRRVVEAAKVLDAALKELGFQGSMAEKLRRAGPRFANVQPVWDALKLRNKIAHEVDARVSDRDATAAAKAFARALDRLC